MARANKQAQSDRSTNGSAFEREMQRAVTTVLEADARIDAQFEVVHSGRQKLPTIFERRPKEISPDLLIRYLPTAEIAAFVAAKTSSRERWAQDELALLWSRETYPGAAWIFATKESRIPRKVVQFATFDYLFTTSSSDWDKNLKRWLTTYLYQWLAS